MQPASKAKGKRLSDLGYAVLRSNRGLRQYCYWRLRTSSHVSEIERAYQNLLTLEADSVSD